MEKQARIDEWNERFRVPGVAEVVVGNGGLPKIRITGKAATAEIYLHGAQVTSWQPAGSGEVLFLSARSRWEEGRAIRGGVPVCFPWFRGKADDPSAPAHGFVRTREWNLESVDGGSDGPVTVVCATGSDEATRRWWPHEFRLVHRIRVGKTLRMELTVKNTGNRRFRFEEALHTYFRVGDVARVEVQGLAGLDYLDNMAGNQEKTRADSLRPSGAMDDAYLASHGPVEFADPVLGRRVRTEKTHSANTIVWNPWQQGAAKLADLGEAEWKEMLCVEASNILGDAIWLDPDREHTMGAELSLVAA